MALMDASSSFRSPAARVVDLVKVVRKGLLEEVIFELSPEGVSHRNILGKRVPDRGNAKVLRRK